MSTIFLVHFFFDTRNFGNRTTLRADLSEANDPFQFGMQSST
jgi:hypothetical protein